MDDEKRAPGADPAFPVGSGRAIPARAVRLWATVGGALVLSGCVSAEDCDAEGSSNSCAAPEVTVTQPAVAPGDTVRVDGRFFTEGCNDTGGSDCPPSPVRRDLPVVLTPAGGRPVELTRVDATGELGEVRVTVTLRAELAAGRAVLSVGDAPPVPVRVVRAAGRNAGGGAAG